MGILQPIGMRQLTARTVSCPKRNALSYNDEEREVTTMLCCVIGGALLAFLIAKLGNVPLLGIWIERAQDGKADASNWRLHSSGE